MTINMKKEGEFLLLLINLDLDNRPSSDLAAQKFQLKVLSVIDKELSEIEKKTTESKNSLLSLESSFKKLKTILYSTIGIICAVFWICFIFIFELRNKCRHNFRKGN